MSDDNIIELDRKSHRIGVLNNIGKLIDLSIEFLSDVKKPETELEEKIHLLEMVEEQIGKYLTALKHNKIK